MAINREQIKFMINEDLILRAPIYALLILVIWGAISFVMIWVLLNVVKLPLMLK